MYQRYLIQTITVGSGGAASIDFTSIPATYTDLCLKFSLRASFNNGGYVSQFIKFNSSTSGYSDRLLYGTGSATGSGASTLAYIEWAAYSTDSAATASTFGSGEIYIPNAFGSNYKSLSSDSVSENNATLALAALTAGLWSNVAAINSISIYHTVGNIAQYSSASLYGIRGA
jgi:hypothetical protein